MVPSLNRVALTTSNRSRTSLWMQACLLLLVGCASPTYQYGLRHRLDSSSTINSLTFGGEHPKLDQCERIVNYPVSKLRQWFPKRDGSQPDPVEERRKAVYSAQEYLVLNELVDVRIDVREYDPNEQWRRLKANDRIHPFWKYTFGSVEHLKYAWLPGRVFHYDTYNVYTNTLTINSTDPSMALYESAEAKIIRDRRYPGAFLAACSLPIVPLFKDVRVANDVLSYARVRQQWELEKELYPQIYAAYGGDLVSQVAWFFPSTGFLPSYYKPLMSLGGRLVGNAGGHIVIREREMERMLLASLRQ